MLATSVDPDFRVDIPICLIMIVSPPSRVVRTPDEAFKDLPNFNYLPRYDHYGNLRYAFIEEESPAVFHDGKTINVSEISGKDIAIHWETYVCFQ